MATLFGDGVFGGFGPSVFLPAGFSPTEGFVSKTKKGKLRECIGASVPGAPGVYGLLDSAGIVFYVGKAKSLKKRLLGYFRKKRSKEKRLLSRARGLYWQTCPTEFHALLRELELINSFLPSCNVLGVAQRLNPCFLVVTNSDAPEIAIVRKQPRTFLECIGPFHRSKFLIKCVEILRDVFRLRDCPDRKAWDYAPGVKLKSTGGGFDCIRFDLGKCAGPCARGCTKREYGGLAKALLRFLRGQDDLCLGVLKERMLQASAVQQFELAQTIKNDLDAMGRFAEIVRRRRQAFASAIYCQKISDSLWVMNLILQGNLVRCEIVNEGDLKKIKDVPASRWMEANEEELRPWGHFERILIGKWLKKHPPEKADWVELALGGKV